MNDVHKQDANCQPRLRAVVEITNDGELIILPVAASDEEAEQVIRKLEQWSRRHVD